MTEEASELYAEVGEIHEVRRLSNVSTQSGSVDRRLAPPLSTIWETDHDFSLSQISPASTLAQQTRNLGINNTASEQLHNMENLSSSSESMLTSNVDGDQNAADYEALTDSNPQQSSTNPEYFVVPADPVTGYSTLLRETNKPRIKPLRPVSADDYEYIQVRNKILPTHSLPILVPKDYETVYAALKRLDRIPEHDLGVVPNLHEANSHTGCNSPKSVSHLKLSSPPISPTCETSQMPSHTMQIIDIDSETRCSTILRLDNRQPLPGSESDVAVPDTHSVSLSADSALSENNGPKQSTLSTPSSPVHSIQLLSESSEKDVVSQLQNARKSSLLDSETCNKSTQSSVSSSPTPLSSPKESALMRMSIVSANCEDRHTLSTSDHEIQLLSPDKHCLSPSNPVPEYYDSVERIEQSTSDSCCKSDREEIQHT